MSKSLAFCSLKRFFAFIHKSDIKLHQMTKNKILWSNLVLDWLITKWQTSSRHIIIRDKLLSVDISEKLLLILTPGPGGEAP